MNKIKKIFVAVLSILLIVSIFSACGENSADRAKAESLALSEAKRFASKLYKSTYKSASVTNVEYSDGNYIVDVEAKIETNVIYSLEVEYIYPITYTIKVSDGEAKVKDVVYHDMKSSKE